MKALVRLIPLVERGTRQERWGQIVEMWLLEALAYHMRHEELEALHALEKAVRLAEPEGYIRSFVDEGPQMAAQAGTDSLPG